MFRRVKRGDKRFVKYTDEHSNEDYEAETVDDPSYCLYPPLYTDSKTGKRLMWKVFVLNNLVYNVHGTVGGKFVSSSREIEGKNIGKKNATSANEQALLVAKRLWTKKLDKDYVPDEDDEEGQEMYQTAMAHKEAQGGTNHGAGRLNEEDEGSSDSDGKSKKTSKKLRNLVVDSLELIIHPMLAVSKHFAYTETCYKYYQDPKSPNKVEFFTNLKLDGYRCVARVQTDGSVVLTSRTAKQFPFFKHIREAVKALTEAASEAGIIDDLILDGEMYAHAIKLKTGVYVHGPQIFNIIQSSASRKSKVPSEYENQIEYHIFDIVDTEKLQKERYSILDAIFELPITKDPSFPIKRVKYTYHRCKKSEVKDIIIKEHDYAVENGYEGLIIRAVDLPYVFKHRSQKMKKLKGTKESEFLILDVIDCEGTEKGCAKYLCEAEDDEGNKETFTVRPIGTFAERREILKKRDKYIGALLTVRYQTITINGVPLFGSGRSIRHEFEKEAE